MIRFTVLLFNMLGLLVYRLFIAGGVEVSQSVPTEMKPGTEYTIEITINKGATGGFAKFQQDLPEGFTAAAVESKGASFTFTGNAVKFIWTSLPSEEEFKITYKVTPAANAPTGEKIFGGKFFYVVDNAKQSVELEPAKVMVGDGAVAATNTNSQANDNTANTSTQTTNNTTQTSDNTANTTSQTTNNTTQTTDNTANTTAQTTNSTTQKTDNKAAGNNTTTTSADQSSTNTTAANTNTANNVTATQNESNGQGQTTAQVSSAGQQGNINCTRKITPAGGNDYTVELTINKGAINGFAKLNENLPAGFTAIAGQLNKGSFSFSDQKIKIVWVSLPQEPEFTISYKITGTPTIAAQIDGMLSYIENEETKKYVLSPTAIDGSAAANNTQATDNSAAQTTNNTSTSTQTIDNINTSTTAATTTVDNTNANTTAQTADNTNTSTSTQTADNTAATIPSSAKVNYRVQICALKMSRMDNSFFENKYSFSKVDMEQHEGWIKYLVGGFNEYKSARDYREQARSKGVVGPFVTAYNSGRRITVQEALMISSQQWYK